MYKKSTPSIKLWSTVTGIDANHQYTSVQIHKGNAWAQLSKESSSFSGGWADDLRSNSILTHLLQEKGIPWMVCKQEVPGRLKLCSPARKCSWKHKCMKTPPPSYLFNLKNMMLHTWRWYLSDSIPLLYKTHLSVHSICIQTLLGIHLYTVHICTSQQQVWVIWLLCANSKDQLLQTSRKTVLLGTNPHQGI